MRHIDSNNLLNGTFVSRLFLAGERHRRQRCAANNANMIPFVSLDRTLSGLRQQVVEHSNCELYVCDNDRFGYVVTNVLTVNQLSRSNS